MGLRIGIVGAGPAGSACAIALAKRGHGVRIFERSAPPRSKPCGDALLPDAARCLQSLGIFSKVEPHLFRVQRLRFVSPSGTAVDIDGCIHTCERRRFDHLLLDEALAVGAELVVNEVVEIRQGADHIRVRCADGHEEGFDFVVGATGAGAKSLGMYGVAYAQRATAYAMRCYVRVSEPHGLDAITVFYDKELLPGYAWVFPIGPSCVNIGVGVITGDKAGKNLRGIYDRFVAGNGLCAAILGKSAYEGPLRGAPLRIGLRGCRFSKGRLLLCGEAIGTTYAMTGEGIGKAMESGVVAAEVLAAFGDGRGPCSIEALGLRYARQLEARMRDRFTSYDRAQRWMRHPWVVDFVARNARRGRARRVLSGVLEESCDPTKLLSAAGLLSVYFATRNDSFEPLD